MQWTEKQKEKLEMWCQRSFSALLLCYEGKLTEEKFPLLINCKESELTDFQQYRKNDSQFSVQTLVLKKEWNSAKVLVRTREQLMY